MKIEASTSAISGIQSYGKPSPAVDQIPKQKSPLFNEDDKVEISFSNYGGEANIYPQRPDYPPIFEPPPR